MRVSVENAPADVDSDPIAEAVNAAGNLAAAKDHELRVRFVTPAQMANLQLEFKRLTRADQYPHVFVAFGLRYRHLPSNRSRGRNHVRGWELKCEVMPISLFTAHLHALGFDHAESDGAERMRELEIQAPRIARHRPAPAGPGVRLRLRAPAKINFGLEVIGRRPDRYHDIVSVMQAIDLSDEIDISNSPNRQPHGQPNLGFAPTPLTDAALRHLDCSTGRPPGQYVQVSKSIPSAAGLGGGSSDAATTLLAVNRESGVISVNPN